MKTNCEDLKAGILLSKLMIGITQGKIGGKNSQGNLIQEKPQIKKIK